jgi:hypothetical protein
MGLTADPSQEPVTSHPAQISCLQLITAAARMSEVDEGSVDASSSFLKVGKGSHVTDLPFNPRQLHPPFAGVLSFFKPSLLGLETSDAELGILDVVFAFSIPGDLCRERPIILL